MNFLLPFGTIPLVYILLLTLIYIAFISLGLPDSLLGAAWPVMRVQFAAPIDFAGIISMIIAGSTIISSLLSDRMAWKLGTAKVTVISVALTAVSLFGFSCSTALWMICLWSVPYGLGAGAIDAGLNNYVALHYNSRHMSWLHCFWGVGASVSPYIMAHFLTRGADWQGGYRCISFIQIAIAALLFFTLPVWRVNEQAASADEEKVPPLGLKKAVSIPGVWLILLAFFGYCSCEATTFLWTSSYLVEARAVEPVTAASLASLFFLGITLGRFLNGFTADRFGDRTMIRFSVFLVLFSTVLVMLPFRSNLPAMAGIALIGLGCAPIYPCIIHSTPVNFGRENSQAIIGVQMACAYAGTTFMPPLFGLIARYVSIKLFPYFLALSILLTLVMTEKLNKMKKTQP